MTAARGRLWIVFDNLHRWGGRAEARRQAVRVWHGDRAAAGALLCVPHSF